NFLQFPSKNPFNSLPFLSKNFNSWRRIRTYQGLTGDKGPKKNACRDRLGSLRATASPKSIVLTSVRQPLSLALRGGAKRCVLKDAREPVRHRSLHPFEARILFRRDPNQ